MPGAFVFGSNDYYSPTLKNPAALPRRRHRSELARERPIDLPWRGPACRASRRGLGGPDQRARRASRSTAVRARAARRRRPAHRRDDYDDGGRRRADDDADLTLGVVHAPYHRVIDAMAADGIPLVLAGHTHGGQLCVPFFGALVTNCDLALAAPRASARHSDVDLAARLGRARHLAVRPDPVRLPARGDAAHPGPGRVRGLSRRLPVWAARPRRGYPRRASGCGAAW